MSLTSEQWTGEKREKLLRCASEGTPCFAYDIEQVKRNAEEVKRGLGPTVSRFFYAVKANPHEGIIRAVLESGFGVECVSAMEVEHVRRVAPGIEGERIMFTPNFAGRDEYDRVLRGVGGAQVTIDNVYAFEQWRETLRGRDLLVRVDPGEGEGHHTHVVTAGESTKFGIEPRDIPRAVEISGEIGARIVGLHAHVGSGILRPEPWARTLRILMGVAKAIPTVRILNVGGGFGVVQNPATQERLELAAVREGLEAEMSEEERKRFEVWVEPGRFLVAQAGTLLARVTQTKRKGERSRFVGVDAGMNSLIRPALYQAYHHVVNLSRASEVHDVECAVVGPICESGDVLNGHALLPSTTAEGDVIAILTAGAYGHSMSSSYNCRSPAREQIF